MHKGGLIWLLVWILAGCCYGASRLEEWEVTLHHGIKDDEGQTIVDPPYHTAGYMNLTNTHAARLFYYYAQARDKDLNKDAPLVFWTNGGPGGSALTGAFGGYGPFQVWKMKLYYSYYGWDKGHIVLFVGQPVGVGFSYSTDPEDAVHWEKKVGEDMLTFFLEFMELHPELQERELYLTGVSYAGHYVPAIAKAIDESNKKGKNMHLNLKGLVLGNPSIHAAYKFMYMPQYAFMNGLLSQYQYNQLDQAEQECRDLSYQCNKEDTLDEAQRQNEIERAIMVANPGLNPYDIRKSGSQSGDSKKEQIKSQLQKYLNFPEVQKQLGVHRTWKEDSDEVFDNMLGDMMRDITPDITYLLGNSIRILVYSGDKDMICHWLGTKEILRDMKWSGSHDWKDQLKDWKVGVWNMRKQKLDYSTLGQCETLEPLTNCRVYNEGHAVSSERTYRLLRTFVAGEQFVTPDSNSNPAFVPTPTFVHPEQPDKQMFSKS